MIFLPNDTYTEFLSDILCWFRYIDDLFMLWAGSTEALYNFMLMLDTNSYNLKFTMQFNKSSIAFLDVTFSIDSNGTINTSLYRKPTAGNTILHALSAHPYSLVQCMPFSQYLRLRRECSSEEPFKYEADLLFDRLLARGYLLP